MSLNGCGASWNRVPAPSDARVAPRDAGPPGTTPQVWCLGGHGDSPTGCGPAALHANIHKRSGGGIRQSFHLLRELPFSWLLLHHGVFRMAQFRLNPGVSEVATHLFTFRSAPWSTNAGAVVINRAWIAVHGVASANGIRQFDVQVSQQLLVPAAARFFPSEDAALKSLAEQLLTEVGAAGMGHGSDSEARAYTSWDSGGVDPTLARLSLLLSKTLWRVFDVAGGLLEYGVTYVNRPPLAIPAAADFRGVASRATFLRGAARAIDVERVLGAALGSADRVTPKCPGQGELVAALTSRNNTLNLLVVLSPGMGKSSALSARYFWDRLHGNGAGLRHVVVVVTPTIVLANQLRLEVASAGVPVCLLDTASDAETELSRLAGAATHTATNMYVLSYQRCTDTAVRKLLQTIAAQIGVVVFDEATELVAVADHRPAATSAAAALRANVLQGHDDVLVVAM